MTIDERALQAAIPVGSNIANEHLVREIIEAYESAKQKEADGWVLVPRKPTREMFAAAFDALVPASDANACWSAMLAVAPEPPSALSATGDEG